MENIVKSDFAKQYTRLTGLTCDVDALIAAATTVEEKEVLYNKLMWTIPEGMLDECEGVLKELYATVRTGLYERLIGSSSQISSINTAIENAETACSEAIANINAMVNLVNKDTYINQINTLVSSIPTAESVAGLSDTELAQKIQEVNSIAIQVATIVAAATEANVPDEPITDPDNGSDDGSVDTVLGSVWVETKE